LYFSCSFFEKKNEINVDKLYEYEYVYLKKKTNTIIVSSQKLRTNRKRLIIKLKYVLFRTKNVNEKKKINRNFKFIQNKLIMILRTD
jgi:hypothetical protein